MKAKTFDELLEQTQALNPTREQVMALARTLKITVPYEFKLNGAISEGCTVTKSEKKDRLFLAVPSLPYADGGTGRSVWVELSVAHHVINILQEGIASLASGDAEIPDGFEVEVSPEGEVSYGKSK
jgi:hypothetical protein